MPDQDSAPYWAALADGRLELQHCRTCTHWTWPARPICSWCQGEDLTWEQVSGLGEVHSWIVTYQPYGPAFVDEVPYTVALVRLDEQPDLLIPGPLTSDVDIHQGLRVHAIPERVADAVGVLTWTADMQETTSETAHNE
ncbi:hypothetical protein FHT40_006218 [Mycolicibacterium sp. BK556]|uniref:Zn-ribbon domain-containing OB-fold protein n=1 Tax=Mycobacteriaceae TaxID=1762 RepID=UPI001304EE5C|nr:OB-fold domain-containing protein [Mycobacterium sp. BK086]MBB3606527.1 hypothetical protein [Mycolicibacterium sp. BK556]MBB3636227.1 hypothetical protein [Mycolicibacterium sp. BK607]MBB3753519.1 hypothetical protein [Mycolicibacterium sp. BK634]